jgi:hypothetical protein
MELAAYWLRRTLFHALWRDCYMRPFHFFFHSLPFWAKESRRSLIPSSKRRTSAMSSDSETSRLKKDIFHPAARATKRNEKNTFDTLNQKINRENNRIKQNL